jgi:hypothetical protein
MFGFFDPACELLPPLDEGTILVYCVLLPLFPPSPPPPPPSQAKCTLYSVYGAGIFKKSMGARNRGGIGLLYRPARVGNLSPDSGIELPSYVGWGAGTTTLCLLGS